MYVWVAYDIDGIYGAWMDKADMFDYLEDMSYDVDSPQIDYEKDVCFLWPLDDKPPMYYELVGVNE